MNLYPSIGALALVLVACGAGTNADPTVPETDGGVANGQSTTTTAATEAGVEPTDWQTLYADYFAPNTPGHCAACHAMGRGGFASGSTADSMYQGLIASGLIDTVHPTASTIAIPGQSPLSWYNVPEDGVSTLDGRMPDDNAVGDPQAAAAVTSWVAAGAKNNGMSPSGTSTGPSGDDDDDDDGGMSIDASSGDTDSGPSPTDAGMSDAGMVDAGHPDSGMPDAGPETWTELYATWFGPSTPGHCGNSYCHKDSGSSGGKYFVCGQTKDLCFQGLVSAGLVSTSSPATSKLGNATSSPLSWYGHGGTMPDDNRMTSTAAAAAVTAWLKAGATDD